MFLLGVSLFLRLGQVLFVFTVGASGLGSALLLLVFCFPFWYIYVYLLWFIRFFCLDVCCFLVIFLLSVLRLFTFSGLLVLSGSLPHVRLGLSLRFVLGPSGLLSFPPVWPCSFRMSSLTPSVGVSFSI